MLYLAYGSNLHPARLEERIEAVGRRGTGVVHGRRLAFHKRSWRDGSGKCDVPAAASEDRVYGALFELDPEQWAALGRVEGVGAGYEVVAVTAQSSTGSVVARTLVAQPDFVDPALVPFDWYRDLVVEGARFHDFPEAYVAAIRAVRAVSDPDVERVAVSRRLVERLRSEC